MSLGTNFQPRDLFGVGVDEYSTTLEERPAICGSARDSRVMAPSPRTEILE